MSKLKIPERQASSRDDAIQLNRAFKGLGCDVSAIIKILAHRNASQRDDIQQEFETMFSGDLKKQLSSELHGNIRKAVLLWMRSPSERDVKTLRKAFKGPIIDNKAITEIICSRTSSQIRKIQQTYNAKYDSTLDHAIESHTSGDHKKLLLSYISTTRYEGPEIDKELVENDAKEIAKIQEKKSGVNEKLFIQLFSERSWSHVLALESLYPNLYGKELRRVIKKETSGNFKYGLLTILQCADSPAKYFATVLRKAMKGLGTDDSTLIRVIVTRAENDMQEIKLEYEKKYNKSLTHSVKSETLGHYKSFLLYLLGSHHTDGYNF